METKTKTERVKWEAVRGQRDWMVFDGEFVVASCYTSKKHNAKDLSRQIVHEHNTWGELCNAIIQITRINTHEDYTYDQRERMIDELCKAAIAAAEKESCKP